MGFNPELTYTILPDELAIAKKQQIKLKLYKYKMLEMIIYTQEEIKSAQESLMFNSKKKQSTILL